MNRRRVVITASPGSLTGLREALWELGLAVEERPLLSFAPPPSWDPLDRALQRLDRFGGIVFSSPRAAHAVLGRLAPGAASVTLGNHRVWASEATAHELEQAGVRVYCPAREEVGELGVAAALADAILADPPAAPVLFPCGDRRRDELPARLRAAGVGIEEVVVYQSRLSDAAAAAEVLTGAQVVVVASPTVARLLAESAGESASRPFLVAVGPSTAAAARAAGWIPAAMAAEPTAAALAEAVAGLLTTETKTGS